MNQRVLDISAYQGEVDFQRVKQDGIWGVMLKATEGERYLSPAFEKNKIFILFFKATLSRNKTSDYI